MTGKSGGGVGRWLVRAMVLVCVAGLAWLSMKTIALLGG